MIHLHLHSQFSVLDGLGSVEGIVKQAKELGHKAVAITDHASISCMPELIEHTNEYGIKPILGCEFYVVDDPAKVPKEKRYHLTVWAKDWTGVQSIMRQLTLANRQFYYRPRISFKQALDFENCFIGTACAFGILAHPEYFEIYKSLFRKYGDDLFLEIMPHIVNLPENPDVDVQRRVNDRAKELRSKIGGKILLTNDAHYIKAEDAETHRVLLCTQYRKSVTDFAGWGGEFFMKSQIEMIEAGGRAGLSFGMIKEGIESTTFIAENCLLEKPGMGVHLPSIYPDDTEAFLRIVLDGWQEKVDGVIDDIAPYHDRLMHEIKIIKGMQFEKYFLIVHDMIAWARARGIMVGPARGSSAGSLVCYLMDIVQVDPLKFDLYFERFLNPDRVEMPDIDVDFQDDRRGEVFEYVRKKYGDDKTAFINTFGRVTVKSAFRDVARAYKVPNLKINALSKQIEDVGSFNTEPELIAFKDDYPEVVEQATKLDGTIRQVGCHACGYVISSQPLEEVCVLERRKRPGGEVFVTNWDKRESESFGLLKVDILGLTTLSVLNHARNLVFERHGKTIDFTRIPLDDPDVIDLFTNAETAGVFQFEGGGMKSLLKNIQPATFREITDCTALYRPGSLQSGQTQQYVDIARGEARAMYKTEMLKPILRETNGQLVYQEQIMQIFNQLGNFTWAESDKMRKIIGKKLGKDEFNKHKEHFVFGCAENGIKEMVAVQLFDDMAEFASYSFNLSHAVSYTLISFWAAYLKTHYPLEFFAASLSHAGDDGVEILINDMRRFDIQIDIPDINVSGKYYQIDGAGNIRYPLSAIKGVGVKAVETILAARKDGPFENLENFQSRINKRACNKRVVEKLIEAGALESIGFKEIDPAKRSKNFIELIAGYSELPKIKLENRKIDTKGVVNFIDECEKCAKEKGRGDDFILPHLAKPLRPNIMVINNKTKRQNHLLSGKVGQYLLDRLKKSGVEKGDIYVTGAMKCQTTYKECEINSYEAIKQEISLVKPGLIICFVGNLVPMFEPKGKMAKLHGQIKYNSEFDTYVLFSYSPQYAFFQPDKAKELFESAMDKVALVIEGR